MSDPPPGAGRGHHDPFREACDAVRANSRGKTRDQVAQLLRDELTARGIEISESQIRATASLIRAESDLEDHPTGLRGQVLGLRALLRTLAAAAAASDGLTDVFTGARPGVGAIKDPGDRTSAWVEVVLDGDGKRVLRSRRERLGLLPDDRDQVAVRLERNEASSPTGVVDAYLDEGRVGALARRESSRFLPAISAARARGERGLLTLGLSTVGQDAQPRLRIAPTATT